MTTVHHWTLIRWSKPAKIVVIHSPGTTSGLESGTKLSPRQTILLDTELVTRLCQERNMSHATLRPVGSRHLSLSYITEIPSIIRKRAEGRKSSKVWTHSQIRVRTDSYNQFKKNTLHKNALVYIAFTKFEGSRSVHSVNKDNDNRTPHRDEFPSLGRTGWELQQKRKRISRWKQAEHCLV